MSRGYVGQNGRLEDPGRWLTTTSRDDEGGDEENPAAEAAAEAGDVIVDEYDAVLELMSGLEGGDDGELTDAAVVGAVPIHAHTHNTRFRSQLKV